MFSALVWVVLGERGTCVPSLGTYPPLLSGRGLKGRGRCWQVPGEKPMTQIAFALPRDNLCDVLIDLVNFK